MFYRTLGHIVWIGSKAYLKRRVGGTLKVTAALAVVTVAATAYILAQSDDQQ